MQGQRKAPSVSDMGELVKRYRIDYPMTQKELAERSGVSVHCLQNFEHGKDINLGNFIKILDALGLAENLSALVPDVTKRPSSYLKHEKVKMRVRQKKQPGKSPFKWGDEE